MHTVTYRVEIFTKYYHRWGCYPYRKKPWIAKIKGLCDNYEFERQFLSPLTDYTNANRPGTRGTEMFYHLHSGVIYEIFEHLTWKNDKRFFAKNINGVLNEMTKIEVKLELIK